MHFFQQKYFMIEQAKQRSKGHKLWLEVLIFLAVFLCATILQGIAITGMMILSAFLSPGGFFSLFTGDTADPEAITAAMQNSLPGGFMLWNLFSTVIVTAVCLIYCLAIEKRPAKSLGFVKKNAVTEILKGLLVGLSMFGTVVLFGTLCGAFRYQGISQNLSPSLLIAFFFGFLLQGMSEEVLCRGYFMISAARKNSLPAAVLINSLIFALLHLGNPGLSPLAAVNLFLFGFFASILTLRTGNIWCVSAVHAIWNFAQGNLFGLSVSGTGNGPSLFVFEQTGNALLDGGVFGPEGGLFVTIVLAAATAIVLFAFPGKKEEKQSL